MNDSIKISTLSVKKFVGADLEQRGTWDFFLLLSTLDSQKPKILVKTGRKSDFLCAVKLKALG